MFNSRGNASCSGQTLPGHDVNRQGKEDKSSSEREKGQETGYNDGKGHLGFNSKKPVATKGNREAKKKKKKTWRET